MLPAAHRVTDAASFREATRRGRRASGATLVTHLVTHVVPAGHPATVPRAGFVVSKAVGDSVTRNCVKRRLRHLVRARLTRLSDGSVLVVRALPAAAGASSQRLERDLDACLTRSGVA